MIAMETKEQRLQWRDFLTEAVSKHCASALYMQYDVQADPPNYARAPPSRSHTQERASEFAMIESSSSQQLATAGGQESDFRQPAADEVPPAGPVRHQTVGATKCLRTPRIIAPRGAGLYPLPTHASLMPEASPPTTRKDCLPGPGPSLVVMTPFCPARSVGDELLPTLGQQFESEPSAPEPSAHDHFQQQHCEKKGSRPILETKLAGNQAEQQAPALRAKWPHTSRVLLGRPAKTDEGEKRTTLSAVMRGVISPGLRKYPAAGGLERGAAAIRTSGPPPPAG